MLRATDSILRRFSGRATNHLRQRGKSIRLPLTVSLLDPKTRAAITRSSPAMRGYLHDLSKTGLSLIMPSVHFGDPYLMCNGYFLLIRVEFPNRVVSIQAAPVRFDRLDESQDVHQYLIGARILQMTKSDRRYLVQYIKSGGAMPEVMNSVIRRFYHFLVNHFHARRKSLHVPLTVSLLDSKRRDSDAKYSPAMSGYLHDISKTGLSLVLPSAHFGNRYPIGGSYTLRIRVELPNGAVNIQATPVRFDWLEDSQGERRHLIGARITQMTAADRRSLVQYIQQVKKNKAVASETSFAHDTRYF